MDKLASQNISESVSQPATPAALSTLFFTFLKIGTTAFGGFMALISIVQQYAVERRKLLRQEDMIDGISLATILPGPVAVNVVAYVGYRVHGMTGALVSASAVILPAFLLLLGLSYAYFHFGRMPAVSKLFLGFTPAVAAIIFAAALNMGAKAIRSAGEAATAFAAAVVLLAVGGFWITIAVVAASGLVGWMLFRNAAASTDLGTKENVAANGTGKNLKEKTPRLHAFAAGSLPAAPILASTPALLAKLAAVFGGMSLILFGGGYVFIPLMQRIVVDQYSWVTRQEFIDGIALGQVTPGPILISAAFIGYKAAGFAGAAAATLGIFTPPAFVMLLCTRFLDRIKQSVAIHAVLRGIRPAVVGMIAAAGITVVRTAPISWITVLIFGTTIVALLKFKIETVWIIPIAGVIGMMLY